MERSDKLQRRFAAENAAKTHCPHGHAYSGDNLILRKSGARGCRACCRAAAKKPLRTHCSKGHAFTPENSYRIPKTGYLDCRICMRRRWLDRGTHLSEPTIRRIFDGLRDGASLRDLYRKKKEGGRIIGQRKLYNFMAANPKFSRLIKDLARKNVEERGHLRRKSTPRIVLQNSFDIWDEIRAAVPESLPSQDRDEVVARIGLAVCEGTIGRSEIQGRVREFIAAHFRMFSKYGPASLDKPLYEDGAETLVDRVTEGLWS